MTTMALSPDDSHLVVGWRSLFLRQYNWTDGKCLRQWKVFHCLQLVLALGTENCDFSFKTFFLLVLLW